MPNYGIESPYTQSDSELFTEIDSQLTEATRRSTYQPYFEMFQQGATGEYFNNMQKMGSTAKGSTSSGAAGSTNAGSFMDAMQQSFGKQIFTIEEDINKKQMQAQGTINDIIQGNRQTALSLKQLEEGNKGGSSCFDGETMILMSNGSEKKIKDVQVGDKVIGYTGEINTVIEVEANPLAERDLFGFGGNAWFTREHPFLTSDGWKSLAPDKTLLENTSFKDLTKMQVGDKLFIGSKMGDKVAYVHTPIKTLSHRKRDDYSDDKLVYNLLTDGNCTYHANGFVVHTIQPHFDANY